MDVGNEKLYFGFSIVIASIFGFSASYKGYKFYNESDADTLEPSYNKLNSLGRMILFILVFFIGVSLIYNYFTEN